MMRFHVKQDNIGDWRWTLWSSSDIIGDSGEGYRNRTDVLDVIASMQANVQYATVDVDESEEEKEAREKKDEPEPDEVPADTGGVDAPLDTDDGGGADSSGA